jgi:hypothetical protein
LFWLKLAQVSGMLRVASTRSIPPCRFMNLQQPQPENSFQAKTTFRIVVAYFNIQLLLHLELL